MEEVFFSKFALHFTTVSSCSQRNNAPFRIAHIFLIRKEKSFSRKDKVWK